MNWVSLWLAPCRSAILRQLLVLGWLGGAVAPTLHGSESWHVTPGAGMLLLPGGTAPQNGWVGTLRAGYDLNAPLSLEVGGVAGTLPRSADAGESGTLDLQGTWADLIVHLARWERLDPFLSVGAGAFWSDGRGLPDNQQDGLFPRVGAGFLYSLSENWSFRLGATLMAAQDRQACFGLVESGFSYYFGDTTPDRPPLAE
jgi:hypothetical protein